MYDARQKRMRARGILGHCPNIEAMQPGETERPGGPLHRNPLCEEHERDHDYDHDCSRDRKTE